MNISTLIPLLMTGASTGLTCGLSCGACGNPMVNVFLASYLFTHTGKIKKSLFSFLGFHIGKAVSVMTMCLLISLLGSSIVDEKGNVFGVNLKHLVYIAMLVFIAILIIQWFRHEKQSCCRECSKNKVRSDKFCHMLAYGIISGLSPCASLVVILGYASALATIEAMLVGLCFSLANSLIPLLLLVFLTGVLSKEMFKEIPAKIKYFQLATYIFFAVSLIYNLFKR